MADANPPIREKKQRKGDVTRGAILAAAARRFTEKGYADCSLRDIAALSGLKAGSVYYHFPSKEVLLDEVLMAGIERLTKTIVAQIEALGPKASATQQFRAMIHAHITCFLDVRDDANTYLRIYEYLPPVMKRRTRSNRLEYAQIWFDAFDRGVQNGEFSSTVDRITFISFLLDSMNGVIEWFRPSRATIDGVCDMIEATILESIMTRDARNTPTPGRRAPARQSLRPPYRVGTAVN
ncbi:TetR/AcrR family transcriptional regulator [Sphingomonas sp. CL5.1]|uniref:TetR/AcrR family transcriptional regulator n=1 Tax=Sphingomonas sp. CL5.1 TaxID=2653203 RepID=UPI0015819B20|nr:TetR/AcrR family transcriptional regulator [Sphingomonas sp. CL5.1]QKS01117.1 TetR/AcrR family transcriptional regulator [Sphingomonas sp. CL5.1]